MQVDAPAHPPVANKQFSGILSVSFGLIRLAGRILTTKQTNPLKHIHIAKKNKGNTYNSQKTKKGRGKKPRKRDPQAPGLATQGLLSLRPPPGMAAQEKRESNRMPYGPYPCQLWNPTKIMPQKHPAKASTSAPFIGTAEHGRNSCNSYWENCKPLKGLIPK